MIRKAFTLVELLIVIAIVGVVLGLIVGAMGGCNGAAYYSQSDSGTYQCVKTYTVNTESSSSKRVDLRPAGGGPVQTVVCDDNLILGVRNSAELYAQFESGRWYSVSTTGTRNTFWSHFPTVTAVSEIQPPE